MRIAICCSASFYKQANQLQDELEASGYEVLMPKTAGIMRRNNDYEIDHYKTWFGNADDYYKKAKLMRGHFDKIDVADAILVLNYEKNGQANYIGGNVLMEMAIAFHARKPIFVLNDVPRYSKFVEEILGMQPIFLRGDLRRLPRR